jgi:hypothetical protein
MGLADFFDTLNSNLSVFCSGYISYDAIAANFLNIAYAVCELDHLRRLESNAA